MFWKELGTFFLYKATFHTPKIAGIFVYQNLMFTVQWFSEHIKELKMMKKKIASHALYKLQGYSSNRSTNNHLLTHISLYSPHVLNAWCYHLDHQYECHQALPLQSKKCHSVGKEKLIVFTFTFAYGLYSGPLILRGSVTMDEVMLAIYKIISNHIKRKLEKQSHQGRIKGLFEWRLNFLR